METSTNVPQVKYPVMKNGSEFNYLDLSSRTNSTDYNAILNRFAEDPKLKIDLLHAAMGVVTESGEVMDMLKKHFFYGKELDITNLLEESGDIFWYVAIICRLTGKSFEDIQLMNIKKLQKRFPNGFTEKDAIDRDVASERKVLEKHGQQSFEGKLNNEN